MTVRYCDLDLASGLDDGTSWANAYKTFQQALTAGVAGDVIYVKGTEAYAGATALATAASGDNTNGWIKFVGCNASSSDGGGTIIDGTRFTLNVNGQACHGINCAAHDMLWFENMEIHNTAAGSYDGFNMNTGSSFGMVFINCSFHNCGRFGMNAATYDANALYWRCVFYSNTSSGISSTSSTSHIMFCRIYTNGGDGITTHAGNLLFSLIYNNTDDGVDQSSAGYSFIYGCVIDANGDDGIYSVAGTAIVPNIVIACRSTNHAGDSPISCGSDPYLIGYTYSDDAFTNDTLMQFIPLVTGVLTSNVESGEDANDGYVDPVIDGGEDFNLTSTATYRRQPITIPLT